MELSKDEQAYLKELETVVQLHMPAEWFEILEEGFKAGLAYAYYNKTITANDFREAFGPSYSNPDKL